MEAAASAISAMALLGIAAFFSLWAHRAKGNRALTMGLYIVFGAFGFFLFLFGIGSAYRDAVEGNDPEATSILAAVVGIVVGVGLIPALRRLLTKIIPFDPESWPDTVGFMVLGILSALSIVSLFFEGEDQEPATYSLLAITAIAEVALAFIAVGIGFHRTASESIRRLGIVVPSLRQIGIALALVFVSFLVSGLSSVLVQELQPDLYEEISENLRTLTSEVDSIWGALFLGIAAGVGEEILFRGAIQPRYGIIFTAVVFALLHQQYGASFVTVGVFGIGIVFGLERKYLNTTACIITHATYNFLAVLASQYADDAGTTTARLLVQGVSSITGM